MTYTRETMQKMRREELKILQSHTEFIDGYHRKTKFLK